MLEEEEKKKEREWREGVWGLPTTHHPPHPVSPLTTLLNQSLLKVVVDEVPQGVWPSSPGLLRKAMKVSGPAALSY
ncbi:hypothetical protein Pcinc_028403 [Petrolisthes cinctipes]|uniref:Uncharacterized protein n=1 Tax=Petrolisthes cinctipes TaxID=88211 RepID=A0AAE1F380_PETCI|nr:hypothetical protein Pcinc_028403 [Petrolisthes cinctipes]